MLKDNKLYCWALKVRQFERLVVCDYNATETIEKIHAQLEYVGNSKTFANIKQLYYKANKQIVEWLLKRFAVYFNHCCNNTCISLKPIIILEVMKKVQIDLVDMRLQRDRHIK